MAFENVSLQNRLLFYGTVIREQGLFAATSLSSSEQHPIIKVILQLPQIIHDDNCLSEIALSTASRHGIDKKEAEIIVAAFCLIRDGYNKHLLRVKLNVLFCVSHTEILETPKRV